MPLRLPEFPTILAVLVLVFGATNSATRLS